MFQRYKIGDLLLLTHENRYCDCEPQTVIILQEVWIEGHPPAGRRQLRYDVLVGEKQMQIRILSGTQIARCWVLNPESTRSDEVFRIKKLHTLEAPCL